MSVRKIDEKEFNEVLKEKLVFVDFYATWCGPCKMISPIIDKISEEVEDVTFVKVDIDESNNIANMFQIMSIPTMLIFKNGELVNKAVGFMSKSEILNFINQSK